MIYNLLKNCCNVLSQISGRALIVDENIDSLSKDFQIL